MYIYNDIFDQFRSYRYLLYAYSACVYSPYTVIPYIKGVKNPTGQLVEMEHRDGGFHEVTALSPSFNEALLSEFLPTYLSGSQGSLLEGFGPWCQFGSRVTPCVACFP